MAEPGESPLDPFVGDERRPYGDIEKRGVFSRRQQVVHSGFSEPVSVACGGRKVEAGRCGRLEPTESSHQLTGRLPKHAGQPMQRIELGEHRVGRDDHTAARQRGGDGKARSRARSGWNGWDVGVRHGHPALPLRPP